jgi:integrase
VEPLTSLIEAYLAHQRGRGLSPRSVEQGVAVLGKAFLPWCRHQGISEPEQLDQKVLDRWSFYLINDRWSPSGKPLARETVRTYNRAVGQFTRWAQRDGSLGAIKPQAIKKERRVLNILSREEINRLEDAAADERDKLIIGMLADTGLRLGELLSLRLEDLLEETQRRRFLRVRGRGEGAQGALPGASLRAPADLRQARPPPGYRQRLHFPDLAPERTQS